MYLSRFGVKNYKCLGEIDIPLTPIHVLIGQNDSGKTSLLEAMAALYASSQRPLPDIFPAPWDGRELVFHGSGQASVEFLAEWRSEEGAHAGAWSGMRYGFTADFSREGRNCITPGDWVEIDGKRRSLDPTAKGLPSTSVRGIRQGRSGPAHERHEFDALVDVLSGAEKYAFDAKVMAVPAAINPERRFRMDPDGFGLPTLLDDILSRDPQSFIQLTTEFRRFFPQVERVRLESTDALDRRHQYSGMHTSERGAGKGIRFEMRSGQTVRAHQASDGAVLFLGFLALAHLPEPSSLLLIEEPENGIYPKRLGEVIQLLKRLVHGSEGLRFPQVILSTHSPYVLSSFEPEEVTFLSRPPDNPDAPVRARPLRDAPNIRERMGGVFYLGELWYNLNEKELFGEP